MPHFRLGLASSRNPFAQVPLYLLQSFYPEDNSLWIKVDSPPSSCSSYYKNNWDCIMQFHSLIGLATMGHEASEALHSALTISWDQVQFEKLLFLSSYVVSLKAGLKQLRSWLIPLNFFFINNIFYNISSKSLRGSSRELTLFTLPNTRLDRTHKKSEKKNTNTHTATKRSDLIAKQTTGQAEKT